MSCRLRFAQCRKARPIRGVLPSLTCRTAPLDRQDSAWMGSPLKSDPPAAFWNLKQQADYQRLTPQLAIRRAGPNISVRAGRAPGMTEWARIIEPLYLHVICYAVAMARLIGVPPVVFISSNGKRRCQPLHMMSE